MNGRAVAGLWSWIRGTRTVAHGPAPELSASGLVSAFVGAMHESRRNQAAREISRHHDFVREAEAYENRRLAELRGEVRRDHMITSILLGGSN